jgi:RND family efflux transporter MFP subunit
MGKIKIAVVTVVAGIAVLTVVLKNRNGQADEKSASLGKPPVAVESVVVTPDSITDSVDVVGTLSPKFETDVKAEYPGIVKSVYVTEWVSVKKGQKLLSLDTREPEAILSKARASLEMGKANLIEAEAAAQRADREYNRIMKLKESGLATQQAVDESGTQKDLAMARMASVKAMLSASEHDYEQAKLRFSKMEIVSPIDGVLAARYTNVGDMASDKPLFKIVDNRLLDLTMTVPSKSLRFIKTGLPVQFSTEAYPGKTFDGMIKYINPVVNDADRSVKVVAEVPNKTGLLKGGLFVQGKIIVGTRANVLKVPRNALINWDLETHKAIVMVVDDNKAKTREVTAGSVSGEMVETTAGISAGDRVICRGGFNIKDGDKVIIKDGEKVIPNGGN